MLKNIRCFLSTSPKTNFLSPGLCSCVFGIIVCSSRPKLHLVLPCVLWLLSKQSRRGGGGGGGFCKWGQTDVSCPVGWRGVSVQWEVALEQSNGHKEISAEGRKVTGVEGDFGSEHKGRRGGVTVEGKGSEVVGGLMNQLVPLLLCKCY